MPGFGQGGQRTPAGFKFEDMAFMPQSYGMGMPPMQGNDRMLGAVNALAMFAGTLAGNNQVVDVAQRQWLQRERQRTVSHQRSMMMQAAQNKLQFETEQANLDRILKGVGTISSHYPAGPVDPVAYVGLVNAVGDPGAQREYLEKLLPGTPNPSPGAPGTGFRDTSMHRERIATGEALGKLGVRGVALDRGIAAEEIEAVTPATVEQRTEIESALQPIRAATAGAETRARTRATIETKHTLGDKIEDITGWETQQKQPKPPDASKTRAQYDKSYQGILKRHASNVDKMTGSVVVTNEELRKMLPERIAERAQQRDRLVRESAQPDVNEWGINELKALGRRPDAQLRAELDAGAGYDLLSRLQPGPKPTEPDWGEFQDPTGNLVPESLAQVNQTRRAYFEKLARWNQQLELWQYASGVHDRMMEKYSLADQE